LGKTPKYQETPHRIPKGTICRLKERHESADKATPAVCGEGWGGGSVGGALLRKYARIERNAIQRAKWDSGRGELRRRRAEAGYKRGKKASVDDVQTSTTRDRYFKEKSGTYFTKKARRANNQSL